MEKNQDKKANKKKKSNNKIKDIFWILGLIIVLIVVFLAASSFFQSLNRFEYETLSFVKIKDEVTGKIMYNYYYFFEDHQGQQYKYNLYLRVDPRENNVPVNGVIDFPSQGSKIYVSINGSELSKCPTSQRDLGTLAYFITNNVFELEAGLADKEQALENNLTHVTCGNHPGNMVIFITSSGETKIDINGNCHTIAVANCEITQAIEKFETKSIIDAKNRSKEA